MLSKQSKENIFAYNIIKNMMEKLNDDVADMKRIKSEKKKEGRSSLKI